MQEAYDNISPSKPNLVSLGTDRDIITTTPIKGPWKNEKKHLNEDWFSDSETAWWPDCQPIHGIICAGLLQAVYLCLYEPKTDDTPEKKRTYVYRLDSHWLCAGHDVEVACTVAHHPGGRGQVNMLIMTPPPVLGRRRGKHGKSGTRGDFPKDENVWITKTPSYGPGQEWEDWDYDQRWLTVRMRTTEWKPAP